MEIIGFQRNSFSTALFKAFLQMIPSLNELAPEQTLQVAGVNLSCLITDYSSDTHFNNTWVETGDWNDEVFCPTINSNNLGSNETSNSWITNPRLNSVVHNAVYNTTMVLYCIKSSLNSPCILTGMQDMMSEVTDTTTKTPVGLMQLVLWKTLE